MTNYLVKRLLLMIPTLFIASLLVFLSVRLIPGDIVDQMTMERTSGGGFGAVAKDKVKAQIIKELGFDVPIYIQYARWLRNIVLHGDLGKSLWKETNVTEEIAARMPVTFEIVGMSMVLSILISFPIAIISAIRQDTVVDYTGRSFAILLLSIPAFWMGTMIMVFPPKWWGWSPAVKLIPFSEDPLGHLQMFIVPSAVLAMAFSGITMRTLRTMMLEVMGQDYIRTAWAKGLRERVVIVRHALKNALIPVITLIGLQLRGLISGTVIIEQIFALPGLGRLTIEAAFKRDYTIISGVTLTMAVITLLLNLIVDLSYAWVDPRINSD